LNTATTKIANTLIVKLPFPAPSLFPNRKNGKDYHATLGAKQKQKDDGFYATKAAGSYSAPAGHIPLSLLYLTPDKRHRDCDNMLAASKALLDGVALALNIDDKRFKPILVDWAHGPDKVGALIVGVGVQISSGVNL
jgi:crossover junction endodeoxyribonuclease RusA